MINFTVTMRMIALTALFLAVQCPVFAGDDDSVYMGKDPVGTVAYSLPSTVITMEVQAECEKFYAGPYAKYASKYLGVDVRTEDEVHYTLSGLKMTPYVEADMSRRFLLDLNDTQGHAAFLSLSASGLVSTADALPARSGSWRFPVIAPGDYSDKAMTAKLTTEAATLYKSVKDDSYYGRVAMQLDMLVEKSEEERAAEIARIIFSLREQRMDIVTGDTDATYSGSAMGAALAEITRLEQEYLSLFIGYSEYGTQSCVFDMVPDKDRENQMYIAFRFSETAGILPADNLSGRPVVMEIRPENITQPQSDKQKAKKPNVPVIVYRVPAVCGIRVMDGKSVLIDTRFPVYQLGEETSIPANAKL